MVAVVLILSFALILLLVQSLFRLQLVSTRLVALCNHYHCLKTYQVSKNDLSNLLLENIHFVPY